MGLTSIRRQFTILIISQAPLFDKTVKRVRLSPLRIDTPVRR